MYAKGITIMKHQWNRNKGKKLLVLSLAALLLGVNIKSMADVTEAESRKLSVLSVSGAEAFVTKGAVREVEAAAGMPLGQGSKVRTGYKTSLYMEADSDKTLKLDSSSLAEITRASAKKLKITLKSGEMFFNVDKPLAADEELTFDAAQTSMSIRGTSGVLGFEGDRLSLFLIEGSVDWNIGNKTVELTAGQRADLMPGSDQTLEDNGMESAYTLEKVGDFTWKDLPPVGLSALLEMGDKVDTSAIGMGTGAEQAAEVEELLEERRQEQEQREEEAIMEQQQMREQNSNPVRLDGTAPEEEHEEDERREESEESEVQIPPPTSTGYTTDPGVDS